MLSFNAQPPRTRQSHLRTISTEDGRTRVEFLSSDPTSTYSMRTVVPPGPTIHAPPYHWHKYQTETFKVESGIFLANIEGQEQAITAGNTYSVEPGVYHTFSNGSPDADLVIWTGLDPQERERDEAFFRNLYGYLDDCRKAGMQPSLCQICLWLHLFDCYLALPGPRRLAMWVSQWLVWTLGVVVGKWLLGMKESYPEYYAGDVSTLRRTRDVEKKEL